MTRVPSTARTALALAIGLTVILAPACSDDPLDPGPAEPAIPEPPDPGPGDSIIVPPRSASAEAAVVEKSNLFARDLLAYRGLMTNLPMADSTVNTQIANSAWYRDGFEVEPTFLNTVRAFFDAQVAGLDFSNVEGAFAMTVLVPGDGSNIDGEIGSIDETRWESILEKLTTRRVRVVLPRFRVEYDKSLKETLQSLGMTDAFMPNVADFTGISATPPPLYISEVKQKTFVEVSEEGAEAAGTTSVGIGVTSLPPSVIADRPFAYLIRERESGAILFAGVLRRPPGAG